MWWVIGAAGIYALCALAARWLGVAYLVALVESGKPRERGD